MYNSVEAEEEKNNYNEIKMEKEHIIIQMEK